MKINKLGLLGGGAQGKVYKCQLNGSNDRYADKSNIILNNKEKAKKVFKEMQREFQIG